jgi:hypothetical protein
MCFADLSWSENYAKLRALMMSRNFSISFPLELRHSIRLYPFSRIARRWYGILENLEFRGNGMEF